MVAFLDTLSWSQLLLLDICFVVGGLMVLEAIFGKERD